MCKNENKIEKLLKDIELEQVSGGFVGVDWNDRYAFIYDDLGIKHNRHLLLKDTYYIGDTKIPKSLAYTLAYSWKNNKAKEAKSLVLAIKNYRFDGMSPEELYKYLDAKFSW